jgi:hypothetical protein
MVRKGNTSRIVLSNDSTTNTLYSQTISGYAGRAFAVRIGQSEAIRIAADGKVGINQTPDAAGGLVQIRYNEVYTSGTTNLLTSASKAALRIRTSSNSSKSLFFGGIDESATPYLQVGNMSSASGGATATYPLVLQPYGGNVGVNETNPDRDLHISNASTGGIIRLTNTDTTISNGTICGMLEFEQRDSNTPGVSATIRAEMQDTTNGNCAIHFQTGTPSTIGTRMTMHGAGTITVPQGPTEFPDGTTASALVNTSGRQPNSSNDFQTSGSGNKSVGWYTIAVDGGGRSWGRIAIRDTASSRHQAVTIFAGTHYGGQSAQNSIHAISSGRHSGNPIGAVRIKAYGTYDGAMLQVYLRDATNSCQALLLGDNCQTHGWKMKNWIADGTDPGDLSNFANINAYGGAAAYADLNVIQAGGTATDGHVIPGFDNRSDLGNASYKWRDVYCNEGAFNNSDEVLKQNILELTTAEMNAAKRISKLFRTYKWKESVVEKGDDARIHTGAIAQQIQAAMSAEGLDAANYGFFGKNEWYEDSEGTHLPIDVPTRQDDSVDPDTNPGLGGNIVVPAGFNKITRYSVRYTELLAFIAAYNEQRFTSIESRLTALEST